MLKIVLFINHNKMCNTLGPGFRIWILTQADPDPEPVRNEIQSDPQFCQSYIRVGIGIQSSTVHIVKTKILLLIMENYRIWI
jgi:hypothetical protein